MLSRLTMRLRRLEARRSPLADPPYTPPEPPPGWWREFFCLCRELPHGADVLLALRLSEADVRALLALPDVDVDSFLPTLEEIPTNATP